MEGNPKVVFSHRDLRLRFPDEFQTARLARLIRHVALDDLRTAVIHDGRLLTVVRDGGRLIAFDDDDPEFDEIDVAATELIFWRLDLDGYSRLLNKTNQLSGIAGPLNDRLLFLGEIQRQDARFAYVLGLLHEHRQAMGVLRQLPSLLPRAVTHCLVLTHSFTPTVEEERELLSLRLAFAPVPVQEPFTIAPFIPSFGPRQVVLRAQLTAQQRLESDAQRFESDLLIELTGLQTPRRGNVVLVGGERLSVPDVPFRLFLCLVVYCYGRADAYVAFEELRRQDQVESAQRTASEGDVAAAGMPQAIHRLQQRFNGSLDGLPTTSFIQRSNNRVRLSTHRACLKIDITNLTNHKDEVIRRPARALAADLTGQKPALG
jgi:hypothetical protein